MTLPTTSALFLLKKLREQMWKVCASWESLSGSNVPEDNLAGVFITAGNWQNFSLALHRYGTTHAPERAWIDNISRKNPVNSIFETATLQRMVSEGADGRRSDLRWSMGGIRRKLNQLMLETVQRIDPITDDRNKHIEHAAEIGVEGMIAVEKRRNHVDVLTTLGLVGAQVPTLLEHRTSVLFSSPGISYVGNNPPLGSFVPCRMKWGFPGDGHLGHRNLDRNWNFSVYVNWLAEKKLIFSPPVK
ncbi:hypothetical protein BD410DRAFT_806440 [Rickenella mellea]|uniref:Uncharacterized protein n=1 Tax=Rickenella mellea TaxID=50990 RepID=A0A4Y7PU62_9AGAM|nr:hypothetical protein BD410DRAFT_806440 [Rickenella mellea]